MPIINQIVKGGGGSAPAHYIEYNVDANGKLMKSPSPIMSMAGVKDLGAYCLEGAYYGVSGITGNVVFPDLEKATGSFGANKCFNSTGITGVIMNKLEIASGQNVFYNAFYGCDYCTTIDLSHLLKITGQSAFNGAFGNCSRAQSWDFSRLTEISSQQGMAACFSGSSVNNFSFYSLTTLTGTTALQTAFRGVTGAEVFFPSLTPNSFGSVTNQFNNMFYNTSNCIAHFPSNIQSTIGSWTDVTNGFSGYNTTVLFDLPATVTLTGADTVTYTRNPKYDTQTALAWKVGAYGTTNFDTPYYTSGLTDPTVGTTIYSDDACTTVVTTVDSIA